jgi:hypothetical protein
MRFVEAFHLDGFDCREDDLFFLGYFERARRWFLQTIRREWFVAFLLFTASRLSSSSIHPF